MKKRNLLFAIFIFFIQFSSAQNAETERIAQKLDVLIENAEIEATEEELAYFSGKKIRTQIIEEARKNIDDDEMSALADYVALGNYELANVLYLENDIFFLNYAVRIDYFSEEKTPKTAGNLLAPKYNYYFIMTYDMEKKNIVRFTWDINAYSPLNFHKMRIGKKIVLYGISNSSALGAWTKHLGLFVRDALSFEGLVAETVLYSQLRAPHSDDIVYTKDFEFTVNAIHVWGRDYDHEKEEYIEHYESVYKF